MMHLIHASLDESSDVTMNAANNIRMKMSAMEGWDNSNVGGVSRVASAGTGTANVLVEAIQGFTNATSNVVGNTNSTSKRPGQVHTSLPIIKSDRLRISQIMYLFLTYYCYLHTLDDNSSIRIEAIKILSFLAINKKFLLESVLSTSKDNNSNNNSTNRKSNTIQDTKDNQFQGRDSLSYRNSISDKTTDKNASNNDRIMSGDDDYNGSAINGKDVDVFRDGISKLIPNKI
jgi:hypothetical protein